MAISEASAVALQLLETDDSTDSAPIICVLERFGTAALRFAAARGIRVAALRVSERYAERSPALRRLSVDVDAWPAPPAGLFVVEERTVYLRSKTPMTIAHEFGHAMDCALGDGIYHTSYGQRIRRLYRNARRFVTPYAATGIDEYFAEALRAFVEINDVTSYWPRATKIRLRNVDPQLYDYVECLFRCAFTAAS